LCSDSSSVGQLLANDLRAHNMRAHKLCTYILRAKDLRTYGSCTE
jgi:hypothetical protein